jgi:hypothetical protein
MRPYGCSRGDFRSCRCRTQPSQGRSEAFLPSDEDRDHRRALQPEVKDTGVTYRSPTGRGYSSNAELDFHVDSSDVVLLSCYNQAPVGGMSMCASAATAHAIVAAERPDYAATLATPYPFSRNGEEAEDEAPWYATPICTVEDGRVFRKWNRNRIQNAQKFEGVPPLTALQREAMEYFDSVLRRPENMFCMHLAPGDLQILCNQIMLHSRTSFEDHTEADKKRTLYRLWLARPDSRRLPESWAVYYGTIEPGTVRGGMRVSTTTTCDAGSMHDRPRPWA